MFWLENRSFWWSWWWRIFIENGIGGDGHDNDTDDNADDCGDYGDDVTFSGSKSGAWGGDSLNFIWKKQQ